VPSYGVTQAGFVAKGLAAILADMQTQVLAAFGQDYDLSPQTPDGQLLGIVAAEAASLWELIQVAFNQFNREDVEGAGLDNIGDLVGIPREGESYTQVYCTLTIAAGTYPAGTFIANVEGNASLTFSNAYVVSTAGGVVPGILMQAQTAGPTGTINPNTLTVITTPVTGWTAITNPAVQSQAGANAELDSAYGPRQELEIAAEGNSNPGATAAALQELAANQSPPVTLNVSIPENVTPNQLVVGGLTLPPHTYAPILYDGTPTGVWSTSSTPGPSGLSPQQLIAQTIYNNKPAGITPIGSIGVVVTDPILGLQTMYYSIPTVNVCFCTAIVVPRPGVVFSQLVVAIQNAIVAAAVAPTPANGEPPVGQLLPGAPLIGSQLQAVIASVPGVQDVYGTVPGTSIFFGVVGLSSPTNTSPVVIPANYINTFQASLLSNITITQGTAV
jgi:uncharacterized phage protein gp47/JayE